MHKEQVTSSQTQSVAADQNYLLYIIFINKYREVAIHHFRKQLSKVIFLLQKTI
ncbi:hypothetical protein [Spartinivicinus poritis]|uniref:Uncharacterized protein n=1 Tax=Spartinivicinus poritis TaxID=2994640 RepID=A0ABT5UCY5_9GAMM|nr:hypothetical protein [Spartinivicinus sp. A2-2]MDE1464242.1 hypothetical protein [Spartinivicinus sp. A2-2]